MKNLKSLNKLKLNKETLTQLSNKRKTLINGGARSSDCYNLRPTLITASASMGLPCA